MNISGLCSSKSRSEQLRCEGRARSRAVSALTTQRCSGIWPPGKGVHQDTDDRGRTHDNLLRVHLFWENLRTFPGEMMEVEWERKCLGFPAEMAVLLNPTTNRQNPRIRNKSKLLFIPFFDFFRTRQTFFPPDKTHLIYSLNINSRDMA